MRTARLLLLMLFISALATACRKGPEDPLLSLRTRKNRISNDWQAYAYFMNGVDILRLNDIETRDRGDCGEQTLVRRDSLEIFKSFRRSGDFRGERYVETSRISNVENPAGSGCSALVFQNITPGETSVRTGFWNFTGGVGNTSSREQVFIYEEETKSGLIWDIIRLANDELKLRRRYIKEGESTFTVEEIWFRPS